MTRREIAAFSVFLIAIAFCCGQAYQLSVNIDRFDEVRKTSNAMLIKEIEKREKLLRELNDVTSKERDAGAVPQSGLHP